jgi:hypothetical protein
MNEILLGFLDRQLELAKNRKEQHETMLRLGYTRCGQGCHKYVYDGPPGYVIKISTENMLLRDRASRDAVPQYYAETLFGKRVQIQEKGSDFEAGRMPYKRDLAAFRLAVRSAVTDYRTENVKLFKTGFKLIDARPRQKESAQ